MPPQNLDRTLHALTSAAESVDNTTAEQVENIQTTHQTEAANINRLGETLEQAVSSGDRELLVNLAAVAEQLNANRQRPITLSDADGPPADYETYIWHDATDGWCFRITELDIEERHHTDPEAILWAAASAAALVCGEPVDIRITVGPSTDGSVSHDRAAARRIEKKI